MLTASTHRLANEKGFTLIELLVVILIIGILAAIALPTFLGQRAKGQDSSAKSNARNAVSQVESCFATTENYANCDNSDAGLDLAGLSNVAVTNGNGTVGYTVTATSASGNQFTMTKTASGIARTCTNTGSNKGGCNGTSW